MSKRARSVGRGRGSPHLALPPRDLAHKSLPVDALKAGTLLFRSHAIGRVPLWFGPRPGSEAEFRFDAPAGQFGVCYAGRSEIAALVETYFRDLPVRVLSLATLERRAITALAVTRTLRLVRIHGTGLPRLGATSAVGGAKLIVPPGLSGGPYAHSQAWSLALHDHPGRPDGLQYRSSHDDELLCVALFGDRTDDALRVSEVGPPISERKTLLSRLIERYGVQLI